MCVPARAADQSREYSHQNPALLEIQNKTVSESDLFKKKLDPGPTIFGNPDLNLDPTSVKTPDPELTKIVGSDRNSIRKPGLMHELFNRNS